MYIETAKDFLMRIFPFVSIISGYTLLLFGYAESLKDAKPEPGCPGLKQIEYLEKELTKADRHIERPDMTNVRVADNYRTRLLKEI